MQRRTHRRQAFGLGILGLAIVLAGTASIPVQAWATEGPLATPVPLIGDTRLDALSGNSLKARLSASASGDYRIDSLVSGFKQPGSTITYSFYSDAAFGGAYYGSETGVHEVSPGVKANVRKIMAWYSSVMNVNLVEVTETPTNIGVIRFMCSNTGGDYAYTYYPASSAMFSVSGDVHLNPAYDVVDTMNGFQNPEGRHGYSALAHEIGHALGLKHPFEGSSQLPSAEDNNSHTIMTYTFLGQSPGTGMAYDLLALQYLYGARSAHATTPYAFARADQYQANGALHPDSGLLCQSLLWDDGAPLTLDFSAVPSSASGYRIDMRPGGWISTGSSYLTTYMDCGVALAYGTQASDFVNSSSDDTVYASSEANVFGGYAPANTTGRDVISGATEADTLDLSAFSDSSITRVRSGGDLVLTLNAGSQVTVVGYYAGSNLEIVTAIPVTQPSTVTLDTSDAQPRFGDTVVLSGAIASAGGAVAGRTVLIETRLQDGSWAATTSATSGGDGSFSKSITVRDSATYRARFAGDATYLTSTSNPVTITMRPRPTTLSLHVDAGELIAGSTLTFSGVLTGEGQMPADGRPIAIDAETSGTTRQVASAVTDADGSFTTTAASEAGAIYSARFEGDRAFGASQAPRLQLDLVRPTSVSISFDTATPAWGAALHATGVVSEIAGGAPAAGTLWLERLDAASGQWVQVDSASTVGTSTISFAPKRAETLRLRYEPDGPWVGSTSDQVRVAPLAALSTVSVKRVGALLYDYAATISPSHATGSHEVLIRRWLKTSTGWKYYGYVTSTAISSVSASKLSVRRSRLAQRGSCKLQAYHPADAANAATWSKPSYFFAR